MGFFSGLFGRKSKQKPQKTLSLDELIRSCTEDGVLYRVTPARSLDEYREVFFFDADDKKIRFREMSTDAGIKSLTFDKLTQCQIDVDGALNSEERKAAIAKEVSTRETDVIVRFWFKMKKVYYRTGERDILCVMMVSPY